VKSLAERERERRRKSRLGFSEGKKKGRERSSYLQLSTGWQRWQRG